MYMFMFAYVFEGLRWLWVSSLSSLIFQAVFSHWTHNLPTGLTHNLPGSTCLSLNPLFSLLVCWSYRLVSPHPAFTWLLKSRTQVLMLSWQAFYWALTPGMLVFIFRLSCSPDWFHVARHDLDLPPSLCWNSNTLPSSTLPGSQYFQISWELLCFKHAM